MIKKATNIRMRSYTARGLDRSAQAANVLDVTLCRRSLKIAEAIPVKPVPQPKPAELVALQQEPDQPLFELVEVRPECVRRPRVDDAATRDDADLTA